MEKANPAWAFVSRLISKRRLLDVRVGNHKVPDRTNEVSVSPDKLAQGSSGGTVMIEIIDRKTSFFIGFAELHKSVGVVDVISCNGLL